MMKTVLVNGYVLSGKADMEPVPGMAVVIEDEKILSICKASQIPSDAQVIDVQGGYIMPGLINLHVHLAGGGKPQKKQRDNAKLVRLVTSTALTRAVARKLVEGYATQHLNSGVTTIRTVGGILDMDARLRDRIQKGEAQGPRILTANMAISVEGGHMAGSLAHVAHTPEEARQLVRKIAATGPNLIKLMITGGVLDAKVKGEPGALKMMPELIQAACEEAHSLGFQVAAHAESPEGVKAALRNGVDTIEHGAAPDAEMLQLFKERGAALVTTISPAVSYALFDPSISHASEVERFNGRIVFKGIVDCAKACLEAGIPVGLGSDTATPFVTQYDTWRELYWFHHFCGVDNRTALCTGTCRNASIAGLGGVTGTLEVGKRADIIVSKNNPLEDLRALQELSYVIADGRVCKDPALKKNAYVEQQLETVMEAVMPV